MHKTGLDIKSPFKNIKVQLIQVGRVLSSSADLSRR